MRFAAPACLWLLVLVPLAAGLLAWSALRRRRALARFAEEPLVRRLVAGATPGRRLARAALIVGGVFWLVLALARPQFGVRLSMVPQRGLDAVIVLDVSRSMLAEDVRPNRLNHATLQIRALLDRLRGDRVGLVLFAGQAFVQCPLTLDHGAIELLLEVAGRGAVAVEGTSLGDALRAAGTCFDPEDRQHKAVVVFSDGEAHTGDALGEARRLAAEGVRVFTIGVGSPGGELIPVRSAAGEVSFHRDSDGQPVKTRLDERALQEVARVAGGEYYRSTLGGGELEKLAEQLRGMEGKELGSRRVTTYEERFQIPGALGLLCFVLEALLGEGRPRAHEWRGRFA